MVQVLGNPSKGLIIILVPFLALAFGGVERWATISMELIVFTVSLCYFINSCLARDRKILLSKEERCLNILFAAILLLVLFQIVPLPRGLLHLVSPSVFSIMKETGMKVMPPFPSHLSINSFTTLSSLVELASYFFTVVIVSTSFKTKESIKKAICLLAVFSFIIAMFGLIQKFTWNGKLYWIKPLTSGGSPFGPFVNHNHFAAFINMIIFPFLSVVLYHFRLSDKGRRLTDREEGMGALSVLILIILITSLLFTFSRGGMAAFGAALLTMIFLLRLEREKLSNTVTLSVVTAAVILVVSMIGAGPVIDRLSTFLGIEEDASLLHRFAAWRVIADIIRDFPVIGTGLGTLQDIFTIYRPASLIHSFDYAHNEYIQLLEEMGMAGLVVVSVTIIYFIKKFNPLVSIDASREIRYIHNGLFCGIVALMVHNTVEFNLRIPANAYLFSVLIGLTVATATLERKRKICKVIPFYKTVISLLLLSIVLRDTFSGISIHQGIKKGDVKGVERALQAGRANPDHGVAAGDFYLGIKMLPDAILALTLAVDSAPFRGITWAKRGMAYEVAGYMEEAKSDMETALKLDPVNASYRLNLARLYYGKGRKAEGTAILKSLVKPGRWLIPSLELMVSSGMKGDELLALVEKEPALLAAVGRHLSGGERLDDAKLFFKTSAVIAPDDQKYLDGYAGFLLRAKNYDELESIRDIFRDEAPARTLYWAGEGYLKNGSPDKAADVLQKLVDIDSNNILYLERLAEVYLKLEKYDNAILMATRAVKMEGKSQRGLHVASVVYEIRGEWLKVINNLKQQIILQPRNFYYLVRLANAYEKLDMKELALKALEDSLEITPDNLEVRLKLGDLYLVLNRMDEAINQYQTALTLDPGNRAVIQRLDRLIHQ